MSASDKEQYAVFKEMPFMYKDIAWSNLTSPDILRRCHQFEYRPDDVIVATYPRSGTTLTQEIVWQIVNHDVVQKDEQYGTQWERFPFLELDERNLQLNDKSAPPLNPVDSLPKWTTKRLIKTHLPFSFIRHEFDKVNPKMVVVMRNPKDNVVSRFNFSKKMRILAKEATFEMFWQIFMNGSISYGDFCDFNSEYWALRDRANVLVVRYEDLVYQPLQEVRNIALFLGYSLSTEKLATIAHNTTFAEMSKNKDVNFDLRSKGKFLRKGKVGDWKDWLTVAQNEAMDAWVTEKLSDAGLRFTYE